GRPAGRGGRVDGLSGARRGRRRGRMDRLGTRLRGGLGPARTHGLGARGGRGGRGARGVRRNAPRRQGGPDGPHGRERHRAGHTVKRGRRAGPIVVSGGTRRPWRPGCSSRAPERSSSPRGTGWPAWARNTPRRERGAPPAIPTPSSGTPSRRAVTRRRAPNVQP